MENIPAIPTTQTSEMENLDYGFPCL